MNVPKNTVTNLIFGKYMQFNSWGDIVVENRTLGNKCLIKMNGTNAGLSGMFKSKAKKDENRAKIEGFGYDKDGKVGKYRLSGGWLTHLQIEKLNETTGEYVEPTRVFT